MQEPLTEIERRVLDYLVDFLSENTYQPSIREIGHRFRIKSTKTVAAILQSLELKGYVERRDGRSRGLRLLGHSSIGQARAVPLYSRLSRNGSAGDEASRERYVAIDRQLLPADDAFFVRAADDAMAAHGIRCGDLVLVNPAARAHDGEAVVARIGHEAVVRLLSHRGALLALTEAASGSELLLGPGDDFEVVGTVAGVMRDRQETSDSRQ